MLRKMASLFLAVVMAVSLNGIPAATADSLAPDGGMEVLFESAAANGLLAGIDGGVKPEDDLTRAKMASILSCAFGAAEQAPLSGFTDMEEDAWYYAGMAKAVHMGVFLDDGDKLNPEGIVTREEAFQALCRVFKLQGGNAEILDGLKDKDSFSPGVLCDAAALLQTGYIAAEDGYLNPKANLTLAGFLQILDGMVKCYLNREGTYTSVPEGSVMINVPDVTLKDIVVKGDLILGDGIGDGSVTLEDVTVTGRTLIRGGGAHSIKITGSSSLQHIVIARVNGELRVFAQDGTEIGEVFVDGRDDVTIEGNFASVTLAADSVTVTAVNAQIGAAGITGENSRIIVAAGSDVHTLTVDGANAAVEVSGTVTDIVVNGGGTAISGEGQVSEVYVSANDVKVTTPDTLVTAAAGTSGVTAGTRDVPEGTTVNTTPEYDEGAEGEKPAVTSVSPALGPVSGGAAVTVTGKYFTGATSITFGGKAASSYTVVSGTRITAVTPAGSPGAADVKVTTAHGTGTKADAYTYVSAPVIASVSPDAGPVAGGAAVSIAGSSFTGATSVTIGGAAAVSYTVDSDTRISAVTPAGVKGPADITVTAPGGTGTKAAAYTYAPIPSITSIGPGSGPLNGGGTVIITGSGFTGATSVTFGGAAASYTIVSDTSITAVIPAGAAGPADVAVTTPGGTKTQKAAYIYAPVPSIASVSPGAGPVAGGTAVTVAGTGFTGAALVTFGGTAASSYTVVSDTQIAAVTPWGDAGPADIVVTTAGGTGTKTAAYTYCPAVNVYFTAPNAGPLSGGNTVSIIGAGLEYATAVTFGGVDALSFTVLSDNAIQAAVPAGAAGLVDVAVTTPGGTGTAYASYIYIPAPSITSVSPNAGSVSGGTLVNITGTGFTGVAAVTFGGIPATSFTVVSDTSIMAAAPAGIAGNADVAVTAIGGTGTAAAAYAYIPAPAITSVSPGAGPVSGGTAVTVTGSGFTNATLVLFGLAPATSFTVVSDSMIVAVTPPGIPGSADVSITATGGTGVKTGGFTYVLPPMVFTLLPASGTILGGTVVTIVGFNFEMATAVTFGSVPAASFTVNSGTQITATAPAGIAGMVSVTVTTPGGTSLPLPYQYVLPPTVGSISPDMGPLSGGSTVTITGSHFTGATAVAFGGAPAIAFTVVSDTSITAVTPAGTAGTVDAAVTTAGGTSNGIPYTYVPVPSITSISPNAGPVSGGSTVIITGTGFSGATSVAFGATPAISFTVDSNTQITATIPAGTGTVSATVTTAGGTSNMAPYTYMPAPAASSVSPSSGPEAGGNTVTITGTNLTGAILVQLGSAPAVSFTIISDTQIVAVAPAGTGTALLTVTTAGGTSNGLSYTYIPAPYVSSINPGIGRETGGTVVTLTGTGFAGATSVSFGSTPAASFTVDSNTRITAAAPAGAGAVPVTVTTAGGTSNGLPFTYAPLPSITSISPSAGPEAGGTAVTITGSGFTWTTSVSIDGILTVYTVVSDTCITATAPAGTAGLADVLVISPGGTSNAVQYAYVPAPLISSISPGTGEDIGMDDVIITGGNLAGATAVSFGTTPALSFTVDSGTQITAIAPPGSGTADVSVTTAGGTSNVAPYTYMQGPVITTVVPNAGPASGGKTVVITGQNFVSVTAVYFGATPAVSFTVDSPNQITAVAPAGTGTTVIRVTRNRRDSNAAPYTYVPAPAVSAVTPSAGPLAGGSTVTISGTDFSGASSVTFDGVPAISYTVVSDTLITVVTPAHVSGTVNAAVTAVGGTGIKADAYTYVPAPTIISVTPSAGSASGGDTVTIAGSGLSMTASVSIGGTDTADITIISDTEITAVSPAGTAGAADVVLITPGGSATAVAAYTYVPAPSITSVSPDKGTEDGGNTVTITGSNYTGATAVTFGGIPASSFTVVSDTEISATTPAHTPGTVNVAVTTTGGTATAAGAYSYIPWPAALSASPAAGPLPGGNTVILSGINFTWVTSVSFGGVSSTSFTVDSDTQITAIVPAGDAGSVGVTVTSPGGSCTSGGLYTYVPAPAITSVSPNAGQAGGGDTVTITGSNFTGTTAVFFGAAPATSFTVNADTQITATAPAGSGTVNVRVTTAGGTSNAAAYTYIPAPAIASITPNAGRESGGTTVVITGQYFTGITGVSFGAAPAVAFTVDSDTQITATAPAGTGTVSVKVSRIASDSNTVPFTYVPAPAITTVSPDHGSTAGDETVTITGTGFTGATSVVFADIYGSTPAASFTVDSDTQITAVTPEHSTVAADVAVTTPGGTSTYWWAYTFVSPMAITSVEPDGGLLEGGTGVAIHGTGFTADTSVTIGGEPAENIECTLSTLITATAPAGTEGPADVTVTKPYASATMTGGFTYVTRPNVTSVSPLNGPLSGGDSVTISGENLTWVTSVSFGGTAAASFTIESGTSITATVPAGAEPGLVDITVSSHGITDTLESSYTYIDFTPVIDSVDPNMGPAAGGDDYTVNIWGSRFTGAESVTFGGTAAAYVVYSDTQIGVIAPAGTGTVAVTVTTPYGLATKTDAYTYIPAPSITSVSPDKGPEPGGGTVTITGTGFAGTTAVAFGGTAASFSVDSDTQITATAPAEAAGKVDVKVTTLYGSGTKADAYTYFQAPAITSVSPSEGSETGGTPVTITGTGFDSVSSVEFGGTLSAFTVVSDTQITATAPAGFPGPADVTVTTPGGTDTAAGAYTYVPLPSITSVSPDEGSEAGGNPVTITGTGLLSASSVKFGGTPSAFTIDSDTQITATAPAGAAGPVDVTVTTLGGTDTASGAYTYVPAPTITSVSPNEGPAAGGGSVVITGTGFAFASSVKFGGTLSVFTIDSDTQITATVPAGAAGPADVTVTSPGGTATASGAYTYN